MTPARTILAVPSSMEESPGACCPIADVQKLYLPLVDDRFVLLVVLQDELVAGQLQQACDKAQKWKQRCAKLRHELMDTQTSAASLEAALNVGHCKVYIAGCHCLITSSSHAHMDMLLCV